jgi:predicted flap endonuclease-1-like 5' DNA nuclease
MITLALQIFLLLLSAYLAGCMVGCILRRALYTPKAAIVVPAPQMPVPEPLPRRALPPESARFETALTGKPSGPMPVSHPGEPVVEVRPRPATERYAGANGTADIEIVKPPLAPLPEDLAKSPPQPAPVAAPQAVEPQLPEPAPELHPVVNTDGPDTAPQPAPEPAAPVYSTAGASMGAAQVASYAAVAAAAAAARAAAEADEALRVKAEAEAEAEAEPEVKPVAELEPGLTSIPLEPEVASVAVEPEPVLTSVSPEPEVVSVPAEPDLPAQVTELEPEPEEMVAEIAELEVALPPAPQTGSVDDLKRIRGIDPSLQERLNGLGIVRFQDVATWSADDVARISGSLDLGGRIGDENWIEQAQILARASQTDYSPRQTVAAATTAVGVAAAAAAAAANATAQKSAGPDRFTRIIGIDPQTEQALYGLGVTRYSEIAQWSSAEVERIEAALGRPGRVGLDNWIEQARVLARYAGETIEPRPMRLADAIRENRAAKPEDTGVAQRSDVAGLRSVKSQALRGEGPAPGGRVDDLKRIRGVGVLIEKRLNALGISSYEQVANWTKAEIDSVSTQLDFRGRIERENWIEQARILASGGQTEFSRRVDRGEVETSS